MPQPIAYPDVVSVRFDASSVIVRINGNQVFFKEIEYSRKRTRKMVYLNSPDPVGKTRGQNAYTCDLTLMVEEAVSVRQQLGIGPGDVFFAIVVTAVESALAPFVDTIIGCTYDDDVRPIKASGEPIECKIPMSPLKIYFNGIDDLGNPLPLAALA